MAARRTAILPNDFRFDSVRAAQDTDGSFYIKDAVGLRWNGSYDFGDGYIWNDGMLWSDGKDPSVFINIWVEQE